MLDEFLGVATDVEPEKITSDLAPKKEKKKRKKIS